ncbi:membrane protein [Paramyrothecium foliicola]|nr:membrane protein [Paramyrothecium foliicola]
MDGVTKPGSGVPSTSSPLAISPASVTTAPSAPLLKKTPMTPSSSTAATWNTRNLGLRLGSDLVGAASAGFLVAPIISIIDRSIMENASGRNSFANSIRSSLRTLFLRPHAIFLSKPFALIFLLYGGTYLTANAFDTASSTVRNRPANAVSSGTGKFAASSAANVALCVYKDNVFVRLFGPPGVVPRPVTPASYALFALRDCLTIFASFNVPPLLAPHIDSRLSADARKKLSGLTVAQFAAPAAVQLFSTPIHLLGLDLYNRPSNTNAAGQPRVTFGDRCRLIGKNWLVSTSARICRIIPGFGVGAVVNMKVRGSLMSKLD